MTAPESEKILEALSYGVVGEHQRGLATLQPMVDAGPRSTYAMLGALAEMASKEARETNAPGTQFGISAEVLDGAVSVDVMPPSLRFAARFITAWASRDEDTAEALFWAVAEPSDRDGTDDLADAITAVYGMAVAAAEHTVLQQQRRQRETGESG
ncbi:hypothetical protein [Streptomyces sp. NPDC058548]|uniref:hypothetical protein n=1 Tax=Streptomyces sp. NPDC058548 TaxID=3346545 RepID=UPI003657E5EF